MRNNNSLTGRIDWILVILLMALIIMGVTTLYSVAFNEEHPIIFDVSQLYGKQLINESYIPNPPPPFWKVLLARSIRLTSASP